MRVMRLLPVLAIAALAARAAEPPTTVAITTIHQFRGQTIDGAGPVGALTADNGALVGVTHVGGTGHSGTIFSLTPAGNGKFIETLLYNFQGGAADGAGPVGGLVKLRGALYGTTSTGGARNLGTLFRYSTESGETVLHNFSGGTDGGSPRAALTLLNGKFYGTTRTGGGTGCFDQVGCGTVFMFDPATGAEQVLYAFQGGLDGAYPEGALTPVGSVLYGTTAAGGRPRCFGALGCGTVFKYDLASNTFRSIHAFRGRIEGGGQPTDALVAIDGKLYGTTRQGGGIGCGGSGCGTVYVVDPADNLVHIIFNTFSRLVGTQPSNSLHAITHRNADGTPPITHRNNAAGLAPGGGMFHQGTLFSVDLSTHAVTSLYQFTGAQDGGVPRSDLTEVGGTFYGTTYRGGRFKSGTVFSFTP